MRAQRFDEFPDLASAAFAPYPPGNFLLLHVKRDGRLISINMDISATVLTRLAFGAAGKSRL